MLQYLHELTVKWKTTEKLTESGKRIQKNVLGNHVFCNISEDERSAQVCTAH